MQSFEFFESILCITIIIKYRSIDRFMITCSWFVLPRLHLLQLQSDWALNSAVMNGLSLKIMFNPTANSDKYILTDIRTAIENETNETKVYLQSQYL